jgi:hypothetical protein
MEFIFCSVFDQTVFGDLHVEIIRPNEILIFQFQFNAVDSKRNNKMLRNTLYANLLVRVSNKTTKATGANLFARYTTKLNTNDYPVSHTEEINPSGKKVFFCR